MNAAELVCVVDDDQSMRRALRRLFTTAGYAVETFASAEAYLDRKNFEGPVCVVLDVRMPGLNGLELQQALEQRGAGEQIVFITGHADVASCRQALQKGAVDFLVKPFDGKNLIDTIKGALRRSEEYLSKRAGRYRARTRIETLTPREFEVLRFVISGLLNKQIAGELCIAERTIKAHRARIMQKLGATSVPDLVWISRQGDVSPAAAPHWTKVHHPVKS